jgi:hypothetical protein
MAGLPRLDGGLLLPSTEPQRCPRPGMSDLSSPAVSYNCSYSSRSREGGEILPIAVDPAASVRRWLVGVAAPVPASHHATRRCRDRRAVGGCDPPHVVPCRTRRCCARHASRPTARVGVAPTVPPHVALLCLPAPLCLPAAAAVCSRLLLCFACSALLCSGCVLAVVRAC